MPELSNQVLSPERRPRRGRPVGSNAANTRERILAAAGKCFNSGDYSEVSMSEIASLAGISGPAIYVHFESKEDLFIETATALMLRGKKIVADAASVPGSWKTKLGSVLDAQRKVQAEIDSFPLIYSAVQSRMVRYPERYASTIALRQDYARIFQAIAQQAVNEGDISASTDTGIAGELLMAFASNSIGIVRYYHQERGDLDRIIDTVKALLSVRP